MKKVFAMFALVACMLFAGLAVAGAEGPLKGKVIETMDSGGYTYAQIEDKGKKTWVAVPQAKIKKGTVVTFEPGMPMQNFKSKSLNRTFDVIIFSGGVAK